MCAATARALEGTLKLIKCKATPNSITVFFSAAVEPTHGSKRGRKHSALDPDNYMLRAPSVRGYATLRPLPPKTKLKAVGQEGITITFASNLFKPHDEINVLVQNVVESPSVINAVVESTEQVREKVSGRELGEISGTLVDENGQPFVNRRVHIRSADGKLYEVPTDKKGQFKRLVPKGSYQVFADEDEMGSAVPIRVVSV